MDEELYEYCSEQVDMMLEDLEKTGKIGEPDFEEVDKLLDEEEFEMECRVVTQEECGDCTDYLLNAQGRCCTKYCPLNAKELEDEGL